MSASDIALLVAAAVLVFWVLGAYNRLVALRNTIGQAFEKVEEARRQRSAALPPLLDALREPLAERPSALEAMTTAHAETEQKAEALRARPVAADRARDCARAEALLEAAASRLFTLVEVDPTLQQSPPVQQCSAAWREATGRLGFARLLYNEAAVAYDQAIGEWPTRLLVRSFGFRRAGQL